MDVRPVTALKTLSQRGLALILANALFWQPLLASAEGIVVSGPGTTVGQAGNGVPVVNIATPNGSGLSHNQFKDYNVGPNGVILNNANGIVQSTQLGGIIVGNPNLKGGAANVILNEVKGGSPSQLRGYTEVAGQSAKVIVANPYGISCNGCGFINTPNVTLTTGKPVIDQAGQLKSYQVDGGAVTIDGKGLNASNVDRFEIITRSAKINAQINAKQLTVIAGRNDVDAQSLKTTARADDGSAKPELAIDSSALGGMYAGAIKLVGTEAGVGVKLDGTLAASGGDIQLDANGHLSMAQAAASGAVDIKAASLETKGAVYAGTTLKAQTKGTLKNSKTLAARDSITLASNGQLTNSGIIEAGVNPDNTRNAGGDVSLDSQRITNTGTVIANRSLTATAQSLDNQGATLSAKQALNITAASVDNRNTGRLLSDGAQTLNVSGLLDNSQGGIIDSSGAFTLNGNSLDNSAGSLTGGGAITLDLIGDLINRNGKLASAGPLLIQRAAHINNQGGKLASQGLLTVFANSVDNQSNGTLAANDGLVLTTSGLLQNSGNGLIHSENAGVTITAGTLDNNGGRIAAKAGDAQIDATDFNNGSGALFARDRVHLTGMNVDNGGEIAGNRIDVGLNGALTNRGLIESATALDVETASLNNSGQMRALGTSGKTRYAIGSLLNNSGSLETANDQLSLAATRFQNTGGKVLHVGTGVLDLSGISLDEVGGSLVTNGDLTLDKANWTNSTAIQAGRLTVNVGTLNQTATGKLLGTRALVGSGQDWTVGGSVASQGSLDLSVGNLLNDHGLIFSGGDLNLKVDRLKNLGATIYAMGNLRVDRDGQGGLATSIINSSGTLESERNLILAASTIQNIRTVLNTESGIYSASITPTACIFGVTGGDCDGPKQNRPFLITQRDHFIVTQATAASSITSGGNMLLTGGELLNSSSSIAAGGGMTVRVDQLTNIGLVTHDTQYDRIFTSERERKPGGWYREAAAFTQRYSAGQDMTGVEAGLASFIGKMESEKTDLRKTTQLMVPDQSYAAVIQAGGSVDVKAQAGIDNSVVRGGYTYVGSGANTHAPGYSTLVSLNPQLPPDVAQQQVNPLGLPGFDLPTGENGLFHLSDSDGAKGLPTSQFAANPHKYLIETNPLLTDMRQFMSSDYMLSKLGYDPDTAQKRLGDGFYEQRLIQQAVLARTGQRFIDGQTSDADLFKHLMDNAISSKSALNLSVGVSLTAEQVAALTHDIVWLENATVAGQQVLVPVLYLAQAGNRLAPNGALISGTDVNLITGRNLNNAGTLRATGSLLANAGGNLTNSGLMEAGGRLDLLSGNNLTNRAGGVISAGNVNLAAGADLLNERSVTTHASASSYRTERSDFVDSAARIESANDLTLQAGGNFNSVGGVLKSGADTTVKAVGDVNITASKTLDSGAIGNRSSFTTIAQQGSVVDAGRDLHVIGGRDISAVASQVEAKRDVNLIATRDLNAVAAANEQHSTGNTKKVKSIEDHVQQVSSVIKAGGDATLSAGQNLQLVASQVNAGSEAYLVSGKNLELKAAENQDYSFYSKTKKTSQGKKFRLDETDVVNNVGSLVSAGTNSTVVAGADLLLAGSAVTAEKGATQLVAGQDVNILAVSNADSARHERKESKSSWGGLKSSKVQDKVDEKRTTALGSMVSGETVTVAAKRDATVTGSNLVSTGDLAVQAGRDLTIDAAQNTFARTDMHKEKNRDLTGVLTGNKLGLDDMTGNQKLYINSSKHNGTANEMTLTGSTIGSSAGNVSLRAGRELKVVASDLVSTKNMELSGANVTVTSGMETASQTSKDSSKSLAVGRVIAGSVVDTATSMRDAVKAARSADDPRLKAVKIAQAALAAYNLNGQASDANAQSSGFKNKTGGTPGNGSLIKIGTELANNRSKNSSEYNSITAKQSTLNAGQDLSIVATGAATGTQGDIQITGSSLRAANTLLLAKNDVLMQSAQNTTDRKNEGSKNKTAIGASFNIGEQNGFTLDLGAQGAKNNGNGNSVTQVNSTLDTGSLLLQSGGDTTLKGAQVRADRIKADIGGNLNIISLQDTESSRSKQSSAGFGASICVPPFCYGSTVAGSANLAAANMNSDYKGVTDQSGLYAGTGGYDINVGKNTTLQGAVIASEASADKNRLSTDRLIVSDIKNVSEIKSQSAGISVSSSSTSGASMGGSIPIALKEKDHSYTRSAVSKGTIVVRNADGANDLVGLNRDTANANQKLDRPDEKAMQERIDLIQSSAQLASGVISAVGKAKADEAKALADKAKTQTETGSPDAAGTVLAANAAYTEAQRWQVGGDKRLMADIASGLIAAGLGGAPVGTTVGIVANTASSDIFNKIGDYAQSRATDPKSDAATRAAWAEGGAARVMLHALAGAAIGLSSGNVQSGALGAGASAALMPSIADALGKNGIRGSEQETLAALVALGVGASVGGSGTAAGAVVAGSTATAVEQYNRQAHPTEARLIQKEADKLAAEAGISPAEAERRMAAALASYTDKTWKATIEKAGESQFDPLTLKHLGEALAPLASIYENSAMYPEGTRRTYSADETVNLLKNFSSTHASEYRDGNINISYLGDPDTYKSAGLVDYYKANLDYRDKVPSAGGAQGSGAGLGRSVLEMAQGMSSLFKIAFGGNSLEEANKLIDPFVEPSSDMAGEWITRNGGQGLVFGLQGNTYEQYAKNTKLGADLLLMGMPGSASQAGKVEQVAKVAEAAKAERKLAQQLHDLESVLPPEKPTGYSVAFETALNPADFGRSRDVHFNRSNAALDNALSMDSAFAQMMETLIPNIKSSVSKVGGRQTPSGWTWEHASSSTAFNQEGIMRLVPTAQHTPGSPWWRVLHPDAGAAGGYSEWAIPRGAPKN
ncbi:filamentous hemagglutinin [Pseudomonas sp. NFR09]|uniref:hemagglutinin repeat-containing protein n=1 Tax=Pseudomonas sp. NFR09 TaxID=1566249 RepID=UPI0008C27FD4|nr:hemagglutinin repeat-containing protein [Pseudomonas sp. NFR09]SET47974.1 filamentous hemagglutinin [Pseudomonas sp. NFR09]